MKQVTVANQGVRWPHRCAACGGNADRALTIKTARTSDLGLLAIVFVWSVHRSSISHPICAKHRLRGWIASHLSQRAPLNAILGFISVLSGIGAIGSLVRLATPGQTTVPATWQEVASLAAFPLAYWGLFLWARRSTPVKFEPADARKLRFRFANDDYAADFRQHNPSSSSAELHFAP
jgi:hypothetical protein